MTGPSQLTNEFATDTLKFSNRILEQNDSYEITINGFQVRKINEMINVIFGLRYGKPSSALKPHWGVH